MKSLRFAFLTTFYPPYHFGGDAVGIRRLAHGLARRGHVVEVVHDVDAYRVLHRGPAPAPIEEPPGVIVHSLRSGLGPLSPLLTQQFGRPVANGRRIRAILDAGAFDVIHFHNVSLVGGPGILAYGDALKVYTAHEHWLVCPTHVLWRHKREPCVGRQCLRCQIAYRRPPQAWRATGLLEKKLDEVDLFLAASTFSRRKHYEFGFPRAMEVLPYFLPDEEPPAVAATTDGSAGASAGRGRPYFLFVGRLEKLKGLDDVLPLFREPGEFDLLVVGEGTHGAELRRIAGDAARVRFLGRVPDAELERCYAHALALLVPSVGFETFGITVIEGFRHGLPVLARNIGPLPELVETSGGGELFATPAELASAMRRLHADPALRERLGRAGRAAFEARWSEGVVVPQYLELVRRAAESKGRRSVVEALS